MKNYFLLVLIALFVMTGCNEKPDQNTNGMPQKNKQLDDSKRNYTAMQYIQDNLALSQKKEDVVELLGSGFKEFTVNDEEVWRFDIGASKNYVYELDLKEGVMNPDLQSIVDGKINVQLYIWWQGQKVHYISAYYLNDKYNQVYNYKIKNDGKVINAFITTRN
jgi:hypothetical protein